MLSLKSSRFSKQVFYDLCWKKIFVVQAHGPNKMANKPRGGRKKNGYKLPGPIPLGEILRDTAKREWKVGPSIGVGGFGEIYCASNDTSKPVDINTAEYVLKIEPHENGPLFVEMHFYMRVGKSDLIDDWMEKRKLKALGMPRYIASGSHEVGGKKYRFLVLQRFGQDLWKIFTESKKLFPLRTIFQVGYQLIDILEYIHSHKYIHGDVKGANLLLGFKPGTENQVYLVDFGLACLFCTDDFKFNPKKAHNGTLEYTSRDAHVGVSTRRGDLEILGFNMLHWASSRLPWEKSLNSDVDVHKEKEKFMAELPKSLKQCFNQQPVPAALDKYLKYVATLKYDQTPNYDTCRKILKAGIEDSGGTLDSKLIFRDEIALPTESPKKVTKQRKPPRGRKIAKVADEEELENEEVPEIENKKRVSPMRKAKQKKGDEEKKWQQFPTIVASGVTRPGEYNGKSADSGGSSKDPPSKKRVKKARSEPNPAKRPKES